METSGIGRPHSRTPGGLSGRKPSGHQEQVPEFTEPSIDQIVTQESEAKESRVFQPELGQTYQANSEGQRPVTLSFDKWAIKYFVNNKLKIDLEQAQLVSADGSRFPLDARISNEKDPAQRYALNSGQKLGADAESWQFRVPGIPSGVFGTPHGVELYSNSEGQGLRLRFLDAEGKAVNKNLTDDFQGLRVDTRVFRTARQSTLGPLAMFQPEPSGDSGAELPYQNKDVPGVTFKAPSQESLEIVQATFNRVLGRVAKNRKSSADLELLKIMEQRYAQEIELALKSGGDIDGYGVMIQTLSDPTARQALEKLTASEENSLSNDELLSATAKKLLQASTLEVIVIPKDKQALDCLESPSESDKQRLATVGRAHFMTSNPLVYRAQTGADDLPVQRLFIGEEVLETELGIKAVLMHELLHVFEQIYASPEEQQEIEASFREAEVFQSLYGSSRDEYLTTLGEEFFGTHGTDGPAWLHKEHPRIHSLLTELVSRD